MIPRPSSPRSSARLPVVWWGRYPAKRDLVSSGQAKGRRTRWESDSPRYSEDEFARRGQAIYEKRVRPQVEEGNTGRVVAIDVETGEFEVADDPIAAADRLFARCADAQPWLVRIGHRALHRFGVAHAVVV